MSNIGNKGKFNDRLKRMKLIRYAKRLKLKVGETLSFEDNIEVKNKVIGGASVGIAILGSGVSNLVNNKDSNSSVENYSDKVDNFVNKPVENSKNSYSITGKGVDSSLEPESPGEFIKRKAVETASVGAAVIGAVGVNLLGGTSFKSDTLKSASSSNGDMLGSGSDNLGNRNIDFGDESKRSVGKVFRSGNDIILVDRITDDDISKGDKKTYLASQIVKKIKREFEKKLDEIEVLESELYLLNEKNENELDLEKCKEIKKEIEEAIEKVNHLIEQYNIYQYNHFLDDMLDIDDKSLVDDISDFKRLYEGAEIQRRLVSDYELISKYQSLYDKLDNVRSNVLELSSKNEDKIIDYDNRDKKYEKMQKQVTDTEKFEKDCEYYIEKQNQYIDDIEKKVGKIDIEHLTSYRMKGFGSLVSGAFGYLSMMFRRGFNSTLPGIAFRNYMAYRTVNNLRSALRLERVTNTIYKVSDFQFELNEKINTLDYNYESVGKTLEDVKKLKSEFMDQYNYDIPGYNETLRKINEIEGLVYQNQEKLDIIRDKLKKNKKLNEDTLKKCRILEKETKPNIEEL